MASGAPVLAAKSGGVPEIRNSPEIGRLVSDFAPAAFARTVVEMPVGYPAPLEGEFTHKP